MPLLLANITTLLLRCGQLKSHWQPLNHTFSSGLWNLRKALQQTCWHAALRRYSTNIFHNLSTFLYCSHSLHPTRRLKGFSAVQKKTATMSVTVKCFFCLLCLSSHLGIQGLDYVDIYILINNSNHNVRWLWCSFCISVKQSGLDSN